jgi:hypothetical protein
MTYIVGISHNGFNSIISDLRVSYGDTGQNVSLKIGGFFPGCIFGHCGDVKAGRDFIVSVKYYLNKIKNIEDTWSDFLSYISNFDYSSENRFQLLLSCRFEQMPQFFIFDSHMGLNKCNEAIITLGSGKQILDKFVYGEFTKKARQMEDSLLSKGYKDFQREITPYLFTFLLTQMSQAQDHLLLEQHNVGGVFHFISQSGEQEKFQKPTLHLLCSYDKKAKTLYYWQYRTCHFNHCLVLNQLAPDKPQENFVFSNEAALPPIQGGRCNPEEIMKELLKDIDQQMEALPLYYICCIGYTTPKQNPQFGFHLGNRGEYLISERGLSPYLLRVLGIED